MHVHMVLVLHFYRILLHSSVPLTACLRRHLGVVSHALLPISTPSPLLSLDSPSGTLPSSHLFGCQHFERQPPVAVTVAVAMMTLSLIKQSCYLVCCNILNPIPCSPSPRGNMYMGWCAFFPRETRGDGRRAEWIPMTSSGMTSSMTYPARI